MKRHKIWSGLIIYLIVIMTGSFFVPNPFALGRIAGQFLIPYLLILWLCVRQKKEGIRESKERIVEERLKIDERAKSLVSLLGLANVAEAKVKEKEKVEDWLAEIWEGRGYIVGGTGIIHLHFLSNPKEYLYPLYLTRK